MKKIDLIYIREFTDDFKWNGSIITLSDPSLDNINKLLEKSLANKESNYTLIWHESLGLPDIEKMQEILNTAGDVWHSGLLLGMAKKPSLINFIAPVWMFNRDQDKIMRISSFRMHLYGTLFKKEALRHIGILDEQFITIEGAALDLGLRLLKGGAFIVFEPELLNNQMFNISELKIPLMDEVRMLIKHYSKQQIIWALIRSLSCKYSIYDVVKGFKLVFNNKTEPLKVWKRFLPEDYSIENSMRVSVIIPTLRRHFYIEKVLTALSKQTIKPYEVIVIDEDYFPEFYSKFQNALDLKVFKGSNIGQSTARNIGIKHASGEYLLIVDDDIDEIPDNFIETHLKYIKYFKTDVSCGTTRERGIDYKIHKFHKSVKLADCFPTNNVLLKRSILEKSGYFDTNFDKGMQEDHDLGMRIYLSGYLMGVNPFVDVFHHRAPRGGLRENKARKITFSDSRRRIFTFNILHPSSIYLIMKYFDKFQLKEEILLNLRGTFVVKGNIPKKIIKLFWASIMLPINVIRIRQNLKAASELLKRYKKTL